MRAGVACLLVAAVFIIITFTVPFPAKPLNRDRCQSKISQYGNLRAETYPISCFALTPFYWKNGITQSDAELKLKQLGLISIIPAGFNTNLPGFREPVDYVEIDGKIITGRSDFWPILFENGTNRQRLDIVPFVADLPKDRRWAIAAGPWIKVKTGSSQPKFTVQIFGNDGSGTPWLEYTYRRSGSAIILVKKTDRRKKWPYEYRRLVFDWTERRVVLLNQDGAVFVIVKGRADALSIGKLMVTLGYPQAIMMDGGSATTKAARNPVYLVVTKK